MSELSHGCWIAMMGCYGLIFGSFMNVVIYRLPLMINGEASPDAQDSSGYNLCWPGSQCTQCKHRLSWRDNIPLFSWLSLKGQCRYCGTKISIQYPVVEALCAIVFIAIACLTQAGINAAAIALWFWFALALSIIDWKTYLLPDLLTQPLLWLGLLYHAVFHQLPLQDAIFGAIAGYLSLWMVYWGFRLLTGREGMGYGDFKLLAAIGAWCGWQSLPMVILAASLAGIVMAIAKPGHLRDLRQAIPFGPCLALAGWLMFTFQTLF